MLLDALPGAVLQLNEIGKIVQLNATACEWLGSPLLGVAWRDVLARDFTSVLQHGDLLAHDGRTVAVSTQSMGMVPGQIVLLTDVSETRAMQLQLQRRERLAEMGEMMARLSHQVRTPLSTAMLYLSQYHNPALDPYKQGAYVDKSLARLRHIEQMIREMMMFAHGGEFSLAPIHFDELIDDLQRTLAPHLERVGAVFELDITPGICIEGNKVALSSALQNLVMNALEHANEQPRIRLVVGNVDNQQITLCIEDNGPGIARERWQEVFMPFMTTRSDGTGLGLPVVRSVVENHGGSVQVVESTLGGAAFLLTLPAVNEVNNEQLIGAHC